MVSSCPIILVSLLIFCDVHQTKALITLPKNESFPALIVFGDSIVDPGNNNYIATIAKCNYPPYGRDFMGGKPTGRFSNGKIPSDLIVEELGIKELLPAYLDPSLKPADLLTGVSFASGASGYDPLTPKLVSVLSLSDQLNLFKEYIGKVKAIGGEGTTARILSDSLYIVVMGSNDITTTYYATPLRRFNYDISSYTDLLLKEASTFFEELYGLGARKIGVFSIPPLGCLPSQRTTGGGAKRECAKTYNRAEMLFNAKLSSETVRLNNKFPPAKFVYIDLYTPLLDLIKNPSPYGFDVVKDGCCGTGKIEELVLCLVANSFSCQNASKYVFWDGYHPTQRAYEILVHTILIKTISRFF